MIPNAEESRQILGVPADASVETIRQVYLDLVRVWHPDRFQSDARLRLKAEENLRKINDAYAVLKDGPTAARSQAPPRPAAARAAASSSSAMPDDAVPSQAAPRHSRKPAVRWHAPRGLVIAVCCAAPAWAIMHAAMLLRVPALPSGPILQPRILEPMRSIDPSLGVHGGADALTAWAHGDLVDLWKPITSSAEPAGSRMPANKQPAANRAHLAHQPAILPEIQETPANGANLIQPLRIDGQGDLRLANQTGLEAVVRLVTEGGVTVRALYIAPGQSASFRAIAMGVYFVHVELGRNLDARHLRFQSERSTPAPIGPFQFLEITSDKGLSGSHFEVALKPRA